MTLKRAPRRLHLLMLSHRIHLNLSFGAGEICISLANNGSLAGSLSQAAASWPAIWRRQKAKSRYHHGVRERDLYQPNFNRRNKGPPAR